MNELAFTPFTRVAAGPDAHLVWLLGCAPSTKELALTLNDLAALGWTDELDAAMTIHRERGFEPARVVAEHRGGYYVRGERGDTLASVRGRLRDDEITGGMPAVGDWVAICDAPGGRSAIEAILPRRTPISRKTPWLKSEEHTLVANVDTVFLVAGLDGDFNVRRLERYLVTAWESGASPVVVLTKLDVCADDAADRRRRRRPRSACRCSRCRACRARASTPCGRTSSPRARWRCSARPASASRRS